MAFPDPQTVTVGGVAISLPRTSSSPNAGAFRSGDSTGVLEIAHDYSSRRIRRTARFVHSKIAPDPLISAQNIRYSMSVRITADMPTTGYTVAEATAVLAAVAAWLTASTNANAVRLAGGEN